MASTRNQDREPEGKCKPARDPRETLCTPDQINAGKLRKSIRIRPGLSAVRTWPTPSNPPAFWRKCVTKSSNNTNQKTCAGWQAAVSPRLRHAPRRAQALLSNCANFAVSWTTPVVDITDQGFRTMMQELLLRPFVRIDDPPGHDLPTSPVSASPELDEPSPPPPLDMARNGRHTPRVTHLDPAEPLAVHSAAPSK